MSTSCRLLSAGVALLLIAYPAYAQSTVNVDFESYTLGNVDGQDGWTEVENQGGTGMVVSSDNGPSAAGSQCLELTTYGGTGSGNGRIRLEKAFEDVLANGGRLITLQYDVRRVTYTSAHSCTINLPGARVGIWWDSWNQWGGYANPYGGAFGWDSFQWPANDDVWHTVQWTIQMGTQANDEVGCALKLVFDGAEITKFNYPYLAQGYPESLASIVLNLDEAYWQANYDDVLHFDNFVITGSPLPSAIPAVDAGGPYEQLPEGSWSGLQLDGTVVDDGSIVNYRWTADGALLYEGEDEDPLVDLDAGTYTIMLEVTDDTGLRNTATTTAVIGPRPAIADDVAGPWGILNGDIYQRNSSLEIPAPVGVGDEFQVLNEAEISGPWDQVPPMWRFQIVFDKFGNLYWVSWNHLLVSFSSTLQKRWVGSADDGSGNWSELRLAEYAWNNSSVIAGIRYIYVVGGGAANTGIPSVYAFQKSTGHLVWQTELPGEAWFTDGVPKVTLYNDKLYIQGMCSGSQIDHVNLFQVDATTGNLDWANDLVVEMQWTGGNSPGGFVFVPDAFGAGLHGLYWNQMSDPDRTYASYDGAADMVGIKIDPAVGATVMWGPAENIEGPGADRSLVIYSPTTDLIYTPSFQDAQFGGGWNDAMFVWRPVPGAQSPLAATYSVASPEDEIGQGYRQVHCLDFDGRTIHSLGEWDSVRSYTYDPAAGTWDYTYRNYGGWMVNGWGFEGQGCLLQDDEGNSILYVVNRDYVDLGSDPPLIVPARVQALNLSEPADPNGNVPIAEYTVQTWNPDTQQFNYGMPEYGPTPGPDGSLYVIQSQGWDFHRIIRLGGPPSAPPVKAGDYDCDGDVDFFDIDLLLAALGGETAWRDKYVSKFGAEPPCTFANCDANQDGSVDFFDIDAFLQLLGT